MTTTEQVLKAAKQLGQLIAEHEAAVKFESSIKKLQADLDAQRAMNDLNRHVAALAQKEAEGKPIEVEEKHKLADLQQVVSANPLLRELQVGQMDYLDLMRQIDQTISQKAAVEEMAKAGRAGPAGSS